MHKHMLMTKSKCTSGTTGINNNLLWGNNVPIRCAFGIAFIMASIDDVSQSGTLDRRRNAIKIKMKNSRLFEEGILWKQRPSDVSSRSKILQMHAWEIASYTNKVLPWFSITAWPISYVIKTNEQIMSSQLGHPVWLYLNHNQRG